MPKKTDWLLSIPTKILLLSQKRLIKKIFLILIVSFLGILFFSLLLPLKGVVYDDAYVSFRYAKNLFDGKGLVFNLGEKVEGYINFLWVLLMVPSFVLRINVVLFSQILGVIFLLLTTIVLYSLGKKLLIFSLSHFFLPLLFIFTPVVYHNSVRGLETPLFVFLIMLGYLLLFSSKYSKWVGLVSALIVLTRPEGIIFVFLYFLYFILNIKKEKKNLLKSLFLFLLIIIPYVLFKLFYYGDILPNTFYAKFGSTLDRKYFFLEGLNYFKKNFVFSLRFFIFFPSFLYVIFSKSYKKTYLNLLPLFSVILYLLFFLSGGGDSIGGYRFYLIIYTFSLVLLVKCVDLAFEKLRLSKDTSERIYSNIFLVGLLFFGLIGDIFLLGFSIEQLEIYSKLLFLFILSLLSTSLIFHKFAKKLLPISIFVFYFFIGFIPFKFTSLVMQDSFANEKNVVGHFVNGGKVLKQICPTECTISTAAAGAIPFYSELKTYDEVGLVDKYIARKNTKNMGANLIGHEKGDGKYILDQKPSLILFESNWFSGKPVEQYDTSWLISQQEILIKYKDLLLRSYEPVNILANDKNEFYLGFYMRKDVELIG